MKKLLAIILMAALVCSFAGCCFTATSDQPAGNYEPIQQATLPVDSDIIDGIFEGVYEGINSQLTRGSVSGNVYTSEYSGLIFAPASDWRFSSDAEIAETMGLGMDILQDEGAFNEAVAKLSSVYDAVATGPDGSNVNIMYENLAVTGALSYTEEDYLDALSSQLGALTTMTYEVNSDYGTTELSGEEYMTLYTTASYEGINMAQNYYVRKIGGYMCVVIITGVTTDPAVMEAYFN